MKQYNMHLTISALQFPPWVMNYEKNGKTHIYGVSASVMDNVTAALNISYDCVMPEDMEWGSKSPDGTYRGMLSDVVLERANIGFGPFSMDDFLFSDDLLVSDVFENVEIGITSGVQDIAVGNLGILSAFDLNTWICLLISMFLLSLLIPTLKHFSDKAEGRAPGHRWSAFDTFWHLTSSLLAQGTAAFSGHRTPRHVAGAWLLASLVISTYFTSLIVATLTVHTSFSRIDSPEDLAANPQMMPILPAGTQVETLLQYSKTGVYRKIHEMVEQHSGLRETPLQYKPADIDAVLRNKAVILVGKEGVRYELKRICASVGGRFYISQGALFVWKSVWAANKDFPLELLQDMNKRHPAEDALRATQLRRIKWWHEAGVPALHSYVLDPPGGACFAGSQRASTYQVDNLRFQDLVGLFFTYLAFLATALAVLALELCLGRRDRLLKKAARLPVVVALPRPKKRVRSSDSRSSRSGFSP